MEEWNRISAAVNHEINNPLAAIQNMMFLIEITPGATPEIVQLARQSADEVRRIEALARSTLGFFRQANAPDKVDLRASAESVRLLLEPLIRQRDIAFEIRAGGDCVVNAIPAATRHVLLNLVRNACEATNRKGAKVTRNHDWQAPMQWRWSSPTREPALIPGSSPTSSSSAPATKGERGNGMGLWLVKKVLDKHGATIDLQIRARPGNTVHRDLAARDPGYACLEEVVSASGRP